MDSELFIAEMEAARNRVDDDYFDARPQSDTLANRSLFRAAFERGFNQGYALSLRPAQETKPVSACEREGCNETRAIGGHFCPRHDESSELFARPVASEEQRLKSALITVWENLSTIRPDDFKQPDGEAETQVNRAYCAAENALLEVGRLRREGHSVELVPTKGESQ